MNPIEKAVRMAADSLDGAKFGYIRSHIGTRGPLKQYEQTQITGIFVGDKIAKTDEFELMDAYVIIIPNKQKVMCEQMSPEDFLENISQFRLTDKDKCGKI